MLEGVGVGALFGLLLTLHNFFDILIDDRISGISAPAIHRFLATDYRAEVVRAALELVALSLCIGMLVGATVALALRLRDRWTAVEPLPWWKRVAALGSGTAAMFGLVYWHDVAARPALHQPELLDRGGLAAWSQRLVADGLGTTGVAILSCFSLLAVLLWPMRHQERTWQKWRHPLSCLAAMAFAALALSCRLPDWTVRRSASASGATNVLLLAADSLRPDRLDRRRAPNIARWLERATSFERAYTPLARTFPAWVSIASGQYPHSHGIRHMFPRWETRQRHLETLAERFNQAGYETTVVGDFAADIFRRIDLGYQVVRTPTFTMRELVREHLLKNDPWLLAWVRGSFLRWLVPVVVEMHEATDPRAVTAEAIDALDRAGEKPFFLTVFYSTTHFPYAAPGPHHRRFSAVDYSGPYRYAKADTLNASEVMTTADVDQVRALYDGAVFATDVAVGELLDALERRGLAERTIVVITADHGEQLYEHGRSQGHGDHLQSEEPVKVPLAIHDPRRPARRRYASPVSLVDLAPTLLELTRLGPLGAADGRSLAEALDGVEPDPKPIYSETGLWFTELIAEVPLERRIPYPDLTQLTEVDRAHGDQIVIRRNLEPIAIAAKHRMVQRGSLRLSYMPTRTGPKFELCDLDADPDCAVDSSAAQPEAVASLKQAFWNFAASDAAVVRQGDLLNPRYEVKSSPSAARNQTP